MLFLRALHFTATKSKTQNKEIYSCFLSFPVEIYRISSFFVKMSLHVSFLMPELDVKCNSVPLGFGVFGVGVLGVNLKNPPGPCGGVIELYQSELSIDEV